MIILNKETSNGVVYNAKGDVIVPSLIIAEREELSGGGTASVTFEINGTWTRTGDITTSGDWVDTTAGATGWGNLTGPADNPGNYRLTWAAPTGPAFPNNDPTTSGNQLLSLAKTFEATAPPGTSGTVQWICSIENIILGVTYPVTVAISVSGEPL